MGTVAISEKCCPWEAEVVHLPLDTWEHPQELCRNVSSGQRERSVLTDNVTLGGQCIHLSIHYPPQQAFLANSVNKLIEFMSM